MEIEPGGNSLDNHIVRCCMAGKTISGMKLLQLQAMDSRYEKKRERVVCLEQQLDNRQ